MRLRQPTFVEESRCPNVVSAIHPLTANALQAQARSTSILKTRRSASSAAQAVMGNVQLAPLANIVTATERISASGVVQVLQDIAQQVPVKFTRNKTSN